MYGKGWVAPPSIWSRLLGVVDICVKAAKEKEINILLAEEGGEKSPDKKTQNIVRASEGG